MVLLKKHREEMKKLSKYGAKMNAQDKLTLLEHVAKLHAQYWNDPRLASGELGLRRHDHAWFAPCWRALWERLSTAWPSPLP